MTAIYRDEPGTEEPWNELGVDRALERVTLAGLAREIAGLSEEQRQALAEALAVDGAFTGRYRPFAASSYNDDIQDAIDAASAAGGGTVILDAQDYNIGGTAITLPANVSLVGQGREATSITSTATDGTDILSVTGGYSRIADLELIGAAGGGDGINLATSVSRISIRDVGITTPGAAGINFVQTNFVIDVTNVEVDTAGGIPFDITSASSVHNGITMTNCYANGGGGGTGGFDIRNANGVVLVGCHADSTDAYGYFMASARVQLLGCTAEGNTTGGFYVVGSGIYNLIGCRTTSQLLPYYINGAGTTVLDGCESASTPSGNSVQVSASGTGANRLIDGIFDRSVSVNASGVLIVDKTGSSSPESVVVGSVGSIYHRTDGGAGTSLYIKESGTSSTGWVAAPGTQSHNAQTGTTYSLVLADAGKLVTLTNASPITLTVPANSSVAFPVGTQIDLAQRGAGAVTVAGAGGVTVNVNTADTLVLNGQYAYATLVKVASDTWDLFGNLVAA